MSAPVEKHRPGRASRQASKIGSRIPTLDTKRLQLRAPRIYDFEAYASILTDDRAEFMGGPFLREEAWADFTQSIALWMLHGHGMWTVDAQTTPSAGFVQLGFEYTDPEPELGVFLTEEAEGHGYAFEACEAVLTYAYNDLGWETLASYIDGSNDRCVSLMERLGAERDSEAEGTLGDGTVVYRHRKGAV
jgi:RimJ/RimL family protein N-acetyltransferase